MRQRIIYRNSLERGMVSLFIVIFTALLMSIVTISFIQLMTSDQRQASSSDLSQSAYDSAMAGVEDAKRALLIEQNCNGDSSTRCNEVRAAIASGECDTLSKIFGNYGNPEPETKIKQAAGDSAESLDQAYTCVKIISDTPDLLGQLAADGSPVIVPLKAQDSFNRIVVSWGLKKTGETVNLPPISSIDLPQAGDWSANFPAILRAQFITGKAQFNLSDLDTTGFSNTLFLYPSQGGNQGIAFGFDGRRTPGIYSEPQRVKCNAQASSGEYICSMKLRLSQAVSAGSGTTFLNLGALYKATDFKVELRQSDNGPDINFEGVQPQVDSTGRANDLFRRVVSRVELGGTFNYPQAAIETTGNLCKNFLITSEADDYNNHCTP